MHAFSSQNSNISPSLPKEKKTPTYIIIFFLIKGKWILGPFLIERFCIWSTLPLFAGKQCNLFFLVL